MYIFENFRKFDDEDSFSTDEVCYECRQPAEQYMTVNFKYICKTCLSRAIEELNRNFMKHCDDDWTKRKEKENV